MCRKKTHTGFISPYWKNKKISINKLGPSALGKQTLVAVVTYILEFGCLLVHSPSPFDKLPKQQLIKLGDKGKGSIHTNKSIKVK